MNCTSLVPSYIRIGHWSFHFNFNSQSLQLLCCRSWSFLEPTTRILIWLSSLWFCRSVQHSQQKHVANSHIFIFFFIVNFQTCTKFSAETSLCLAKSWIFIFFISSFFRSVQNSQWKLVCALQSSDLIFIISSFFRSVQNPQWSSPRERSSPNALQLLTNAAQGSLPIIRESGT